MLVYQRVVPAIPGPTAQPPQGMPRNHRDLPGSMTVLHLHRHQAPITESGLEDLEVTDVDEWWAEPSTDKPCSTYGSFGSSETRHICHLMDLANGCAGNRLLLMERI